MEQKASFRKSAMLCGLYIGIALIIYQVILYLTHQNMNPSFGWITYVILTVGVFLSQTGYRDNLLDGNIKYSTALGYGVSVMIFAGIIQSLYTVVLFRYIDPSLLDKMGSMQEELMIKEGISNDQIEQMSGIMSKFRSPLFLVFSNMFGYAIYGFIISLITSIFVKKEGKISNQIVKDPDFKEEKND